MKTLIEKIQSAQAFAFAHKPAVGGFPFLAECMRQAGIQKNIWSLPSAQSIYVAGEGSAVFQGEPLVSGFVSINTFDEAALISALRIDQAGQSTFPQFLMACWEAGVISYSADFENRIVTYYGVRGESYEESYPAVEVKVKL